MCSWATAILDIAEDIKTIKKILEQKRKKDIGGIYIVFDKNDNVIDIGESLNVLHDIRKYEKKEYYKIRIIRVRETSQRLKYYSLLKKYFFGQSEIEEVENFKKWLEQFIWSKNTLRQYSYIVYRFLKDGIDINNQLDTNKWLKQHPRTNYHAAIKWYMKYKGIYYETIKLKQSKRKIREGVTREELANIIEKLKKDKEVYWVLKIAWITGARIHEVLNLKLRDIGDNYIVFRKTKTGDERKVFVDEKILRELKKYIIEEKGVLGAEKVFFTKWKTMSAYVELRTRLEKLLDENLAKKTKKTHNFRRAVINYLIEKTGGNILLTKSFIGHKSIQTTERYVYELKEEELAKEASKILEGG